MSSTRPASLFCASFCTCLHPLLLYIPYPSEPPSAGTELHPPRHPVDRNGRGQNIARRLVRIWSRDITHPRSANRTRGFPQSFLLIYGVTHTHAEHLCVCLHGRFRAFVGAEWKKYRKKYEEKSVCVRENKNEKMNEKKRTASRSKSHTVFGRGRRRKREIAFVDGQVAASGGERRCVYSYLGKKNTRVRRRIHTLDGFGLG